MGDVIPFRGRNSKEPTAATKRALLEEAVAESETGFTTEELADLRDALQLDKRDRMMRQMRKQAIAVNTLLHQLLESYRNA